MRMPLRKRSVAKALARERATPPLDEIAAAAERAAAADKRRPVRHKDAMQWLREVGVRKRRVAPPWK